MTVKEKIIMEEKQVLDLGDMTLVAGGQDRTPIKDPFEPGERCEFRIDVYVNGVYSDWMPCIGYANNIAGIFRQIISKHNTVPVESVHIYFQDGHEMDYNGTLGMNEISNGTVLTAHVAK